MRNRRITEKDFDILDNVPVGVFILRNDYVVLFWNRCLEEWTGISRDGINSTKITSRFPHLNDPKYAIRLRDIFDGGPPAVFSSQLHGYLIPSKLPGGKQRIQHATVTSVQSDSHEGFNALFALQDVTDLTYRVQAYRNMRDQALQEINERKRVEEELRKAHEYLEQRVRERTSELQTLNEKLQHEIAERKKMQSELLRVQKLESLGVLAGGIAHDFNNLLTAILGNTSIAKRRIEPGNDAYERLLEAEKASLRARELTRQLLTFAKGGAPIKRTASITELIKESARFSLRGSKAKCEFSLPEEVWPVEADEAQMSRVINNLIINADQAMPDGGTIHIKAENAVVGSGSGLPIESGMYVKISIRDEGHGIPEELAEKIFDPYFTTKPTGTGLGLSIAYSIVKNHNGFITLESGPGKGTTFYIYLPASREKVMMQETKAAAVSGKGRVLVMDDEHIVRLAAGFMLRDLGYEAEFAKDGQEAVDLYRKSRELNRPFDTVIIDLTIPGGMGGKETIKMLKQINPGIKAIVSSGYSDDPIMSEYGSYGFQGVVEKPYTIEELGQTLHRVINTES